MNQRGPDHRDHVSLTTPTGRHVSLLHSRLSIIDLDVRSNQPFRVGAMTLVYNGELYNFVELRGQLAREGATFRTESDTEVLLIAIERWGWAALDRFEGMWALAVFDSRDGSLMLSRDRFGEKPLYIQRDASGLYFGSEVKFIAALSGTSARVNLDQVRRFLVNGYKSLYKGPHSFFTGIEELPAASTLCIGTDGSETATRYWQPSVSGPMSHSRFA
jgi:asparagine synthase (glutamine-hydrolysing)